MAKESTVKKEKKTGLTTKTLIILLLAMNMMLAGAAAGYFFFMKPTADAGPRAPKMANFELGEMLVNLADPSGMHYLRFSAVLVYPEDEKKLPDELNKKQHILQHNVIALMRQKRLAEVRPPESVEEVQQEMTGVINELLEEGQLTTIYFTEYLTQ